MSHETPLHRLALLLREACPGPELPASLAKWIEEAESREKDHRRTLQKARHDLTTLVETANRLNAFGLNLDRIEAYLLRAMMGQFGILKVLVARQRDGSFPVLVPTTGTLQLGALPISIPREGIIARALCRAERPLLLESLPQEGEEGVVIRTLWNEGLRLGVPLLRSPETGERELTGLLFLGPRLDGQPFNLEDIEFLRVLSCLYAMALHNADLYHRSIVDGLTQTYSRVHFDMHLALEIERVRRQLEAGRDTSPSVGLIMVDIDNFKAMNDRYGHLMGDQTLKVFAKALTAGVRGVDMVARYGGEEF